MKMLRLPVSPKLRIFARGFIAFCILLIQGVRASPAEDRTILADAPPHAFEGEMVQSMTFSSVATDCDHGSIACHSHGVEWRCLETAHVMFVCCPVVYPIEEYSPLGLIPAEDHPFVAVNSVEPQIVAAGVGQRVEIMGAGFGETTGNIRWTSADSWGSARAELTITPPYFIEEWSDDYIRLFVPSGVGSGPFTVLPEGGGGASGNLTVVANLLGFRGVAALVSRDGSGGMVFHLREDLPEIARTLFAEAVGHWRTVTGVNLIVAPVPVTAPLQLGDNLNVVGYLDPGSGQTLGQARLQTQSCGGDGGDHVREVDLAFSQEAFPPHGDWTEAQKTQFIAVALHELGHAIGLGHFNSSESVMRAVYTGRTDLWLDPGIAGIHWIRAANRWGCGYPPMDWLPAGMRHLSVSSNGGSFLRVHAESPTRLYYNLYKSRTLESNSWARVEGSRFGGTPGFFTQDHGMNPTADRLFFRVMLSSEADLPELFLSP